MESKIKSVDVMLEYFRKKLERLYIFTKRNQLLLILFLLSGFYFVFQHLIIVSWDFSAYVLNARYMFYGGDYFELYRAPLTYILLSPLLIFKKLGEVIYIILVLILFLYANIKLSDALFKDNSKISRENIRYIFYFFSLSGFVFLYGFSTGSELLNLAFIELFLALLISGRVSGHFLGLAFLSRYNSLIFFPMIFLYKSPKKIIKNILYFLTIIFPWFFYNFLFHDNWFASFIDSYTLNIHLRDYLFQEFNLYLLLPLVNWFSIFFVVGAIYSLFLLFKVSKTANNKSKFKIIVFWIFGFLVLYEFLQIPLKFERYLFNLSLVIAFFSSIGLMFLLRKFYKIKKLVLLGLLFSFIATFVVMLSLSIEHSHQDFPFKSAALDIESLNISECEVLSPYWTPMNYLTGNVRPLGRNDILGSINANKAILIFTDKPTIDDVFDFHELSKYPHLIKCDRYIILGSKGLSNKNCFKVTPYNQRFAKDPCHILGEKMSEFKLGNFSRKICNIVNFN